MDTSKDSNSFLSGVMSGFTNLVKKNMKGEDKALADKYMALLPTIIFANYNAEIFSDKAQSLLKNLQTSDVMKENPRNLNSMDLDRLIYLSDPSIGFSGKNRLEDIYRHIGKPYQSEVGDEPAAPGFAKKGGRLPGESVTDYMTRTGYPKGN